jgi:hypothetical protein
MYQPWIFGAIMAAGTGLVAFTVRLEVPNVPPPEPEPPAVAIHIVPPPAPTLVAEPKEANPVLTIPAIVIEGRRHRPLARVETSPPPDPVAQRPCSNWREIGPTHVVSGTPTGNLSVRELCQ